MQFSENLAQAIRSVRANSLRAVLTLMIIAFGIMALVGILTSIDALLFTMNDNFSRMGANSFEIRPKGFQVHSRRNGRQEKQGDPLIFRQVMDFKERFDVPGSKVSVSGFCTPNATLKYGNEKTNPTVLIFGVDENYLDVQAFDLDYGRNFTSVEQESGTHVAIIGMDIVNDLFNKNALAAMGKDITIDNRRFTVVGILTSKGASMNQSADRRALIPLSVERQVYGYADKNYDIDISIASATELDDAISHATGVMRNINS